jgi:predicted transcriptional regulator
MDRTTLSLDSETRRRLRGIAAERGISMAALIREAIDETIERHAPTPRSLGIAASGRRDTARQTATRRPEPRTWR